MAEQMRQGFCQECNKYTLVKRKGVSHILHLLLSIFTIGAWVFVWIGLAIFNIGGWRCQTCGSDKIKDTGEMLSLRGWIVIFLSAMVILPIILVMAAGAQNNSIMDTLAPVLVLVPVVAIPVMIFKAITRRKRQSARMKPQAQAMGDLPDKVYRPGDSQHSHLEPSVPPGMVVSEEAYERADPDEHAAAEFRQRIQQRDP
ncbi:hypothetical protein [Halomonas aquatica]|uniref:Uncharacterized protein n=1 Tax=Halomonas aquatica TaxID=3151123 RepID=A0ABV1NBX9_9GAMM